MKNYIWLIIISLGFLQACGDPKESLSDEDSIFERVTSDISGVTFKNVVPESETLNQFNYHYFFNGAGVGMGDINNDGLNDLYFASNSKCRCNGR